MGIVSLLVGGLESSSIRNVFKLAKGLCFCFFVFSSFNVQASDRSCSIIINEIHEQTVQSVLSSGRKTLHQFKTEAKARVETEAQGRIPKFIKPKEELETAKTWSGLEVPTMFKGLVGDAKFIDHDLFQANEEGLVKVSSQVMTHLRVKAGKYETNMGVLTSAIMDNVKRKVPVFVREDAKAVLVFIHGGGTKTTGHHVAVGMMGYMSQFKIDTVSIDMPWHGEGPRLGSIDSMKESFEIIREFTKKYVAPAGKPMFLVGHSMGGMIADTYMRLYPNDNLFKGVIPLSTVADPAPGKSMAEKDKIEEEIAIKNLTNPNIPAEERNLSENLARQNKVAPVCGMYCQLLNYGIDWRVPSHRGSEYLPALYIIGEGDALYQGYEKQFADYVGGLNNVKLKVLKPRRGLKYSGIDKPATEGHAAETSDPQTVGHLIFDHRPYFDVAPGTSEALSKRIYAGSLKESEFEDLKKRGVISNIDPRLQAQDLRDPETYILIRQFISDVLGEDLSTRYNQGPSIALYQIFNSYANNLAFREFAKSFVLYDVRATEKTKKLNQRQNDISKEIGDIKKNKKQGANISPEATEKLAALAEESKQIIKTLKGELDLPGAQGERLKEINAELKKLKEEVYITHSEEKKSLKKEYDEKKSVLKNAEKEILELSKKVENVRVLQLYDQQERVFVRMMQQDSVVRNLTSEYLRANYNPSLDTFTPGLFSNLPREIEQAFETYEKLSRVYQKTRARLNSQIFEEARQGLLKSSDSNFDYKIRLAIDAYINAREQMDTLIGRLEYADREVSLAADKIFHLEEEKYQILGNEYFITERHILEDILQSHDLNYFLNNQSTLVNPLLKFWTEWQKIWGDRMAEASESLY